MEDLEDVYRRENLRSLVKKYKSAAYFCQLAEVNPTYLSQISGPNPSRKVSAKTARKIEGNLNLPTMSLNSPTPIPHDINLHVAKSAVAVESSTRKIQREQLISASQMTALCSEVLRTLGAICESESVSPAIIKFANMVVMGLEDTVEHDGVMRPDYLKNLVLLSK